MRSISLQRALKYIIPVLIFLVIVLFFYFWLWQPDYYRTSDTDSEVRTEV